MLVLIEHHSGKNLLVKRILHSFIIRIYPIKGLSSARILNFNKGKERRRINITSQAIKIAIAPIHHIQIKLKLDNIQMTFNVYNSIERIDAEDQNDIIDTSSIFLKVLQQRDRQCRRFLDGAKPVFCLD